MHASPSVFLPMAVVELGRIQQGGVEALEMNKGRSQVSSCWHLHTPGEEASQLRNCLYQIGQWAYLWGDFIDC